MKRIGTKPLTAEQDIHELLRAAGVRGEIRTLAQAAPTAALTADQLGCPVAAIVNSLVFTADGEPVLILASGARRVDLKQVARTLGVTKVRSASPDVVETATGQQIGGVGPLGHPNPLTTVIDLSLASADFLWAGAGLPHVVFRTDFHQLVELTGGIPAAIAKHS
jgi:prolyl-tRNA editing enzyme YbaK/EbsC (Cys-tRNA(Pro) deacylase)